MSQQELLDGFLSLPSEAQRQVLRFIKFLQKRYQLGEFKHQKQSISLSSYEFIGMWRDREDLADSTAWVRRLREREW